MVDRVKRDRAINAGEDLFKRVAQELATAALASGNPLLFYAGYFGGLYGHMGAALGGEAADALVQALRPTFVQAVRDCEKEQSH